MLQLTSAVVHSIMEERSGIQFVTIILDGSTRAENAYYMTSEEARCKIGDKVLVNTTAVQLGLGTGGYHIIVTLLDDVKRDDMYPTKWGHIMKMRYSPFQLAVDSIEEQNSPYHHLFTEEERDLKGTIVMIGELHSYLPILALRLKQLDPELRLAYVMPDSASLPIGISRHVYELKKRGILTSTITVGHAWGGDIEAVTIYTGLLAAKYVAQADLILCFLGPGVVGTGTTYGFSGAELADVIHAVSVLGGIPVMIPRITFADSRINHQGISHHTRTLLQRLLLRPVLIPLPIFGDWRDQVIRGQVATRKSVVQHFHLPLLVPRVDALEELKKKYPAPITTMGRDMYKDSSPFQTGYVGAEVAYQLLLLLQNCKDEITSASSIGQDELTILARLWGAEINGGE